MKEGYAKVQTAEPTEQASESASELQKETVKPQELPAPELWGYRQVLAGVAFCLVAGAAVSSLVYARVMNPDETSFAALRMSGAEKAGAGLLLCSDDRVMLLLRNSKHNDSTWGLPGGNLETGDRSFQDTAEREAQEELGVLPQYTISTSILTKRGKRNQKHYTVFVAGLTAQEASTYQPQLNHEHREARWFPWSELLSAAAPPLHPVVQQLLQEPTRMQLAAALPLPGAAGAAVDKRKHNVEKRGSGLLLVNGKQGIFLRRNSHHNNNTWDLPGGNVDLGDKHLEAAARREAVEEMGACPDFKNSGSIFTTRGKHDEKEFTIYVGTVTDDVRSKFKPVLSDESSACKWLDIQHIAKAKDVHPRVEDLFQGRYRRHLQEILQFDF